MGEDAVQTQALETEIDYGLARLGRIAFAPAIDPDPETEFCAGMFAVNIPQTHGADEAVIALHLNAKNNRSSKGNFMGSI
jgi:hypothetical protein